MALTPIMSERRVSLIGALLVALGPMSMAIYTPAMPDIVETFSTTDAAVKSTVPLYFAGFAFAQLVCGPLSDALGRRATALIFVGIYLAASMLGALSPTIEVLIAARVLQGIGAAAGFAISRAIMRDLFDAESTARIMNLIIIILAVGPALAPSIGGFLLNYVPWRALFWLMVGLGLMSGVAILTLQRETVRRDMSRLRPAATAAAYAGILRNRYFLLAGVVIAGTNGVLYTLATLLAFIMIEEVGFSATAFGLSMLLQTGMFFLGSVCFRLLTRRVRPIRLVPVGLACVAIAIVALPALFPYGPSLVTVMGPVAVFSFGIAFSFPVMMAEAMKPISTSIGAASAMLGFLQMGGGMAGGFVASFITDPYVALVTVVPAMGAIALASWLVWRRLPTPGEEPAAP
jgi:DHA1 family bicyclomycin/chloramphenicol resistance-like MFS transporter